MGDKDQVVKSSEIGKDGSSSDVRCERIDMVAVEAGMQSFSDGKKSLALREFTKATEELQQACNALAKQYGEKDDYLVEPYYYYGKALLEVVRMEADVLGNALSGVDQEKLRDEKTTEETDDVSPEVTEEEKEQISEMVIDAMTAEKRDVDEKDVDTKATADDNSAKEKPSVSPKEKGATDAADKEKSGSPEKTVKDDSPKKSGGKTASEKSSEKVTPERKLEKVTPEKKTEPSPEKESTSENTKVVKDEAGATKEEEMETDDMQTEQGSTANETEKDDNVDQEAVEDEEDLEDEEKAQDEDAEVSNNQVAWEVLELARLILQRNESKSKKLRLADVHMALGEVEIENSRFSEALCEFEKALALRVELLKPNSRLIAETHFQVGVAHEHCNSYDNARESMLRSQQIIQDLIDEQKKEKLAVDSLNDVLKELELKLGELQKDQEDSSKEQVEDKENALPSDTPVTTLVPRKKGDNAATSPSKKRAASETAEPEDAKKPKTEAGASKPLQEV